MLYRHVDRSRARIAIRLKGRLAGVERRHFRLSAFTFHKATKNGNPCGIDHKHIAAILSLPLEAEVVTRNPGTIKGVDAIDC